MNNNLPSGYQNIDKLDPTKPVTPGSESHPESDFASRMQQQEPAAQPKPNEAPPSKAPSPIELAQREHLIPGGKPPSLQQIQSQINANSSMLGDIKNKLHNNKSKLPLKQSQRHLLRSKLASANEHLRSAHAHLGGDPGEPLQLRSVKNPINKFLMMVADGQNQMNSAGTLLKKLNSEGESVNPAQLLLVQMKLHKAQQELDYTSILLAKAIDTIKTLFNIQI